MRIIRIYQAGNYGVDDIISLSESAGQHVGVVLRRQPGEKLVLFSGDNREWDVEIVTAHKKKVAVRVLAERIVSRESPRIVRLAQAISKGEKMEWLVQKAVELGVSEINPLVTQYGAYKFDEDRLTKKHQQWQAIAIAACEQCGRNQVPLVTFPMPLFQFLQHNYDGTAYVLDPYTGKSCREYDEPKGDVTLLIGPEGGFSPEELNHIVTAKFSPLTLGPRILRMETAAICALSVVQAMWGDL
jgi:16S rRNA (uracil1498-N3)-methyltransferase